MPSITKHHEASPNIRGDVKSLHQHHHPYEGVMLDANCANKGTADKNTTEFVCWSVTLEGLLEILSEEGVIRAMVQLIPDNELHPEYFGPRRLRVLAIEKQTP